MLSIRYADPADIEQIRMLTMQVWPQTYTPIIGEAQVNYMLTKFYTPASLQRQMDGGDQFLLCYDDYEPVAFASYGSIGSGIYKLHKLYILPSMQGRGIGTALLDFIKKDIVSRNASELRLNVNRYNDAAKRFYKKAGFTILKDEDIDIGSGYFMNDHILHIPVTAY